MTWSADEVETILEQMRGGATVRIGGTRCNTTYYFRADAWGYRDFDEGYTQDHETSEDELRSLIAAQPEEFRHVLRGPLWRAFSAAFVAGKDLALMRARLAEALAYGDPYDYGKILDAVLAWPEEPVPEEIAALIRSKFASFTAYHLFMEACCWERSAAGPKGVAFCDTLIEIVGEVPGCFRTRASFHQDSEDLEAAVRDLEREREWTREGWEREQLEDTLARVRAAME